MNWIRLTPALFALIPLGCGRADEEYLGIMNDQQVAWNHVADTLETVKDQQSMATAKAELEKRLGSCEAVAQKARDLPKPSPEFLQKHDQKVYLIKRAMERAQAEVKRIQKHVPGGPVFLKQFQSQHPGLLSAVQP